MLSKNHKVIGCNCFSLPPTRLWQGQHFFEYPGSFRTLYNYIILEHYIILFSGEGPSPTQWQRKSDAWGRIELPNNSWPGRTTQHHKMASSLFGDHPGAAVAPQNKTKLNLKKKYHLNIFLLGSHWKQHIETTAWWTTK